MAMAKRLQRQSGLVKVIDERSIIRCVSGHEATVRFEGWADGSGEIVRYNMALIHHLVCAVDNGRVVGYDNAHGVHERHSMGQVTEVAFASFARTLEMFLKAVDRIKANS